MFAAELETGSARLVAFLPLAPFDSSLVSDLLAKVNRHGKGLEADESGAREGELMSCLGATERTESQWRSLIESADLKVVTGIWSHPQFDQSLIEVELP
jgi:hypothetical protein